MSFTEILGLIMLVGMVAVIFIGFPISFTLLFLALIFGGLGLGWEQTFNLAYLQIWGTMKDEIFPAVPLFIFMGYMTEQAGLMERLFGALRSLLASVRGSLYLAVILTATIFAMATGIVGAAVTVLGVMAAPMMIKAGYDARLSSGAIAAGGTLGILIPPSVMLVVMGPTMGVPVNLLYSAAFGPGFLLAGCYIAYTLTRSFINPRLGPPMTMEERRSAHNQMTTEKVGAPVVGLGLVCLVAITYLLLDWLLGRADAPRLPVSIGPLGVSAVALVLALLTTFPYVRSAYFRAIVLGIAPLSALIGFTLGTIIGGLATPTEAASCGAFGAAFLALLYGRLNMRSIINAGINTMVTSAMVLFLAVASNVFGAVFTKLGSANLITNSLLAVPLDDWWKLALIMFIFFVLGWPFEWPVIILVFMPIVLPVVEKLQFGLNKLDLLLWFGALTAVNIQTAFLSPPVAMSAYYLRNVVPQWSLATIYKGMADYMVIQVIVLMLLLLFPQIALWPPSVLR
ncbi:TRAP transporter large permease subunit [Bradyrhizobium sp. AUGA SZCCT0431]|uniref:TRAP transporter large permease n=1 Tax=Bradyrhizobium sp. AUGA SZCCT0431 TaxID=2807674 RepID=UPI001BA47BEE|nr:TRAP transporter large permease subunit [Bradyrhizobium sp. AUGA SZCCT0431]MBR1143747.1 TRAP transporter large permease subunit [Bradyrhizobium sp. AUGA SZCCT0431]